MIDEIQVKERITWLEIQVYLKVLTTFLEHIAVGRVAERMEAPSNETRKKIPVQTHSAHTVTALRLPSSTKITMNTVNRPATPTNIMKGSMGIGILAV
jgi:hypothetical protein